MPRAINIRKCFDLFDETFSPKIIAELNDHLIMAVRCEGDKVPWHTHDNEDEMFLVIDGVLEIHEREKQVTLGPGELCIVERGVEHRVKPRGHVLLLLFEPSAIEHTGKVDSEITKKHFDFL